MSVMTDVTVTTTWTQIHTTAGAISVVVENRSLNQDVLIHASQSVAPTGDAAAFVVRRYQEGRDSHIRTIALTANDELYAKVADTSGTARLTLHVP